MSFESLLPSYSDLGNVSLLVLLVVAAFFYFGKLITSVKIQRFEKEDYYLQGFFFSLGNIVLPFFVVLVLSELVGRYIPSLLSISTDLVVPIILLIQGIASILLVSSITFNLHRFTLFSQLRSAYKKTFEEQKEEKSFFKLAADFAKPSKMNLEEVSYSMMVSLADSICKPISLFVISLLLVWGALFVYVRPPVNFLMSPSTMSDVVYILTFLNITFLSLAFGYVGLDPNTPPARIYLDNGQEVTGKIVKMGEYICIAVEGEKKILSVNSNKIVKIEEAMFKEAAEQTEKANNQLK